MRITDKHIFFWRDVIAQWNMSTIVDPTSGISYNCNEQYMMHQKSLLMGDKDTAELIMQAAHPRDQQALGRTVKNYDQNLWDSKKYEVVCNASMLKFTQHPKLLLILLDSGNRLFVEASPKDRIWGIGLSENDPRVDDEANWDGQNLLGQALTDTRDYLRKVLTNTDHLYKIF